MLSQRQGKSPPSEAANGPGPAIGKEIALLLKKKWQIRRKKATRRHSDSKLS